MVLSAPALDAAVACWKRALAPNLSRIVPMLRIPTGIGSDLDPGDSLPSEEPSPPPWVLAVTARMGDEAFRAQREARALDALTNRPGWDVLRSPEYVRQTGSFHVATQALLDAAGADRMRARSNSIVRGFSLSRSAISDSVRLSSTTEYSSPVGMTVA